MRYNNQRPNNKFNKFKNSEPFIPGIAVVVRNNDVFSALRKFKKKVQEEGIIQTVRKKQEYVKPSEKKRKAKAAAKARFFKKIEKEYQQRK